MHDLPPTNINAQVQVQRLKSLYARLPAGIVSSLAAVFLLFVMLLESNGIELAKAWTAYMLWVLGLRGWLWYAFHKQGERSKNLGRWEAAYAFAALLMGLGWGWLNGPAYPAGEFPRIVILTMTLVVSFTAAVFMGLSCTAFWVMTLPTLLPALWRFLETFGQYSAYAWLLCGACVIMVGMVQTMHHRALLENLRRRIESEALLMEQQAIFQSATVGIAVIQDSRITKANQRLGELLNRRLQDLQTLPLAEHFADLRERDALLAASEQAFARGQPYHGAFRMRRADGREFWAEISGQRMDNLDGLDGPQRSVWLIGEAPLRSAQ